MVPFESIFVEVEIVHTGTKGIILIFELVQFSHQTGQPLVVPSNARGLQISEKHSNIDSRLLGRKRGEILLTEIKQEINFLLDIFILIILRSFGQTENNSFRAIYLESESKNI